MPWSIARQDVRILVLSHKSRDEWGAMRFSWILRIGERKLMSWTGKLVELLSERARAAVEIGRLKRDTSMPIYEPDRERIVFENVQEVNPGPLPGRDLVRIYERIMDVMRNVQKEEIVPKRQAAKRRRSWIRK